MELGCRQHIWRKPFILRHAGLLRLSLLPHPYGPPDGGASLLAMQITQQLELMELKRIILTNAPLVPVGHCGARGGGWLLPMHDSIRRVYIGVELVLP